MVKTRRGTPFAENFRGIQPNCGYLAKDPRGIKLLGKKEGTWILEES